MPPIPRIARVGEFCVVERIYRSSATNQFHSIWVCGLVGLWVCGFLFLAFVSLGLCVLYLHMFVYVCVVGWL